MIPRKVSRWTFFYGTLLHFYEDLIWLLTGPSTPSRKSGRTVKRGGHLVETRYGQVTCTNFYLGKLFSEITDFSLKPLNPSLDTVPPFPSNAQAFLKTLTHFSSTPNLHMRTKFLIRGHRLVKKVPPINLWESMLIAILSTQCQRRWRRKRFE